MDFYLHPYLSSPLSDFQIWPWTERCSETPHQSEADTRALFALCRSWWYVKHVKHSLIWEKPCVQTSVSRLTCSDQIKAVSIATLSSGAAGICVVGQTVVLEPCAAERHGEISSQQRRDVSLGYKEAHGMRQRPPRLGDAYSFSERACVCEPNTVRPGSVSRPPLSSCKSRPSCHRSPKET